MEVKQIKILEDEQIIATMPQTVKVRNYLLRYGSITSQEAWRLYNITRLADVVYKLRHKRHPLMDIETDMQYERDEYNQPIQYGRYIFKGFLED